MAKIVREWIGTNGISIAVEHGKDDANKEETHVHVYKRGRRTQSRIPGKCKDIDSADEEIAGKLYDNNLNEIDKYYQDVKNGIYGD